MENEVKPEPEMKEYVFAIKIECPEYNRENFELYFSEEEFKDDKKPSYFARRFVMQMIKDAMDYRLTRATMVVFDAGVGKIEDLKDEDKTDFDWNMERSELYGKVGKSLIDVVSVVEMDKEKK